MKFITISANDENQICILMNAFQKNFTKNNLILDQETFSKIIIDFYVDSGVDTTSEEVILGISFNYSLILSAKKDQDYFISMIKEGGLLILQSDTQRTTYAFALYAFFSTLYSFYIAERRSINSYEGISNIPIKYFNLLKKQKQGW